MAGVPERGSSVPVARSGKGSASPSTLYRRSIRILGPRRSRRGPSQAGDGRRDVATYRQPPTPLPSAPRLPPSEPAQPGSTRSDSSRPLVVESEAPESCFALISWATCDPAPYCPILPVRLATDVDETASMPGGFAFATDGSRNLSPPSRALRRIVRRSAFLLPALCPSVRAASPRPVSVNVPRGIGARTSGRRT